MWPLKLKPVTRAAKTPDRAPPSGRLLLCLFLTACGGSDPSPSGADLQAAALHIRISPVYDYAWLDRNQSGQPDQFKPLHEREKLYEDLTSKPLDLLLLRGLGHSETIEHLQQALAARGARFEHTLYLPGPDRYRGIGFLSQNPLDETLDLSTQIFRIRSQTHQPFAGAVRIGNLWIWNAKAPPPDFDYEQRRNEARLLSQAIRAQKAEGREVLLSLHSREEPGSPMLRMISETGLKEIQAADERGDRWTFRDPDHINYRRDQWLFASPLVAAGIGSAQVIDTPALRIAGPFRHQFLTLAVSGNTLQSFR